MENCILSNNSDIFFYSDKNVCKIHYFDLKKHFDNEDFVLISKNFIYIIMVVLFILSTLMLISVICDWLTVRKLSRLKIKRLKKEIQENETKEIMYPNLNHYVQPNTNFRLNQNSSPFNPNLIYPTAPSL